MALCTHHTPRQVNGQLQCGGKEKGSTGGVLEGLEWHLVWVWV